MSTIITIMGRPTKELTLQQGQANGAEYISVDVAVNQWNSKEKKEEPVYYKCFFNAFLSQKLMKAKVKQGSTLQITGKLILQPFIYQKGERAGQPDSGAKIEVYDWQYTLSNKPEGTQNASEGNVPTGNTAYGNAMPANGGAAPAGGYSTQGMPNGNPNQGYQNQNYQQQANYSNAPASGYGNAPAPNRAQGQMPPNTHPAATGYNGMPSGNAYGNDGFMNVSENQAGQLPFPA